MDKEESDKKRKERIQELLRQLQQFDTVMYILTPQPSDDEDSDDKEKESNWIDDLCDAIEGEKGPVIW